MRTTIALLAAAALLVPAATAGAATRTIALVAKPTSVTNLVRGGKAPKPGSSFLEYGTLTRDGAKAGSYAIQGVLAAPLSVGVEISTDTFVLAGGTVVAVGATAPSTASRCRSSAARAPTPEHAGRSRSLRARRAPTLLTFRLA